MTFQFPETVDRFRPFLLFSFTSLKLWLEKFGPINIQASFTTDCSRDQSEYQDRLLLKIIKFFAFCKIFFIDPY